MNEPIKTVEEAVAALGPLPEPHESAHGPLWSLLDWSFWGAGMGDVFREALADRMIAAIPARGVEHAEALMAEFIRRRQIEKTGVTVYQEQRDQLKRLRAQVAELESMVDTARAMHVKFPDSEHCQHDAEPWPCPTLAALDNGSATEAPPLTVFRASHDSIVMGLYTTAAEARAHCVAEERCTWAKGAAPVFDWIEDEEDGVAELVTVDEDGETETVTGYVVTALEVAAKYDEGADE